MKSRFRLFALVLCVALLDSSAASAQGRRRAMRSAPPETQVTTFDVIDRAVSEGRISADQAMLYKVFSVYGDSRLPRDLQGDDNGLTDTTFMSEVAARYESLPVDVQQQVAPFLIPPFHRNSWWELRQPAKTNVIAHGVTSYGFGIERPCTDCPLSFDWKFVATANGKAKIWYYGSNALDELKAKGFANEIDQVIWPKLKALMGRDPLPDDGDSAWVGHTLGGDSRLDIALVDIGRSITTARYGNGCNGAAWTYIQFNRDKPREELAHELMHSFQYAFNVKVRGGDCTGEAEYRWLMESTAEWVKDYVYPGSTSPHNEHWAAPHYLKIPEAPLNIAADPHWYGAYLLPFFLARVKGQTNIVGQFWANTESVASLQAIENALQPLGGFEKVWPEFVLHNWNDDPVDDYEKADHLRHRPKALGETLLSGGAVDKYASLNYELHHLTSSYKHFVFNGNVNSVAFLNGMTYNISTEPRMLLNTWDLGDQYKWEPLTAEQKKGASVQAILKKNGKWEEPEDWTNVAYKAFCLQKPEERIEEIVLIFANGNHDESSVLKPAGQPPLLIATDMGCRFEGTVDWDSSAITKQGFGNVELLYRNTFEPRDFMEPVQHFLGYYYNTAGNASWSVTGPVGPCGVSASDPNAGIRTDLLSFSMNFAPKGSKGYRKGYYQLHTAQPVSYALHCPGGDVPLSPTFIYFPAISFDPLMYLRNAPGGGLKDTVSNPLGTWKWDYKVKR
ncbi:MAG: DUF6055 domain-containing protein [Thermoanaerobaculia bacterium]